MNDRRGERVQPRKISVVPPLVQQRPMDCGRDSLNDNFPASRKQCNSGQLKNDMQVQQIIKNTTSKGVGIPSILMAGSDVLIHVLTFLEPAEILKILTMPLSKDWQKTFTNQEKIWEILCLSEPFKAQKDKKDYSDSDDDGFSIDSCSTHPAICHPGKSRVLYTLFVRCIQYLRSIKDDAKNQLIENPIICADDGNTHGTAPLAYAQTTFRLNTVRNKQSDIYKDNYEDEDLKVGSWKLDVANCSHKKRKDYKRLNCVEEKNSSHSMITRELLGPSNLGQVDFTNTQLPWSCAIYSIVNWMVAFSNVIGIQTMCLKTLPVLLEDESHRKTARQVGLADVIIRGMFMFPNNLELHTVSFHAIVLLTRPLGGKEGMIIRRPRRNESRVLNDFYQPFGFVDGKIQKGEYCFSAMLDSMRRFTEDEVLQAMGCWSLVNTAMKPDQRQILIKLGAVDVVSDTMIRYPYSLKVQLKALLALVNLFLSSKREQNTRSEQEISSERGVSTAKRIPKESVCRVIHLLVEAMKNFCSSHTILIRSCYVLYNISIVKSYHSCILLTPSCYQLLKWYCKNCRDNKVLTRKTSIILRRLQATMADDDNLRQDFYAWIDAENQRLLEEAGREAIQLQEWQRLIQKND